MCHNGGDEGGGGVEMDDALCNVFAYIFAPFNGTDTGKIIYFHCK